ncbi:MAG: hypothetical protein ABSA13_12890 [Beijerinckiaceae bacterium]
MRSFTYPAMFEPGEGPGILVVTFRDVPEAISQGDDAADAHAMGSDALGVALLALVQLDRPIPAPTPPEPGEVLLTVEPELEAEINALLQRGD